MKKKNNIEFSCLMSVYYKENPDYLKQAIDSIINQTLLPNEFVIVEDGKLTDELEKVLKEYEKKYPWIRIIKYKENRGLGVALHDGVLECKYPYIARMDSDDISVPDRFEKQIEYLEEHPDVDCLGTNMTEYDETMKNVVCQKKVPKYHEEIYEYLKKRNPMNHPTVIYKKEKVLQANNYEDYPYFEDYYLWAKMIKNGCVFYNIQEELYNFRAGSSMINRRGGKQYLNCIKRFQLDLNRLEIVDKKTCKLNIVKRYIVALLPNNLRGMLYKTFLRKKVKQ